MNAAAILRQLAGDSDFRQAFSDCPAEALRAAGFPLEDNDCEKLESVAWVSRCRPDARLDPDEILCCSVAY